MTRLINLINRSRVDFEWLLRLFCKRLLLSLSFFSKFTEFKNIRTSDNPRVTHLFIYFFPFTRFLIINQDKREKQRVRERGTRARTYAHTQKEEKKIPRFNYYDDKKKTLSSTSKLINLIYQIIRKTRINK